MSAKNRAELILSTDTKRLKTGLTSANRYVRGFASKTKKSLQGITSGLNRTFGSLQGQLGLALSAGGILAFNKKIIDADEKLTRLAIQGSLTKKEMFSLREEMFENGVEAGKFRSEMTSGIDAIVERTGDIQFARATIDDLGKTSAATGAAMGDLGALSSQLNSKFKIGPENLMEGLDILVAQGKKGAFTLQNLAAQGERLFAAAGRLDMTGTADLRRIGAYAQIARMGTGSSEQATTAVERTLANILAKQKKIKKLGFDIRDKNGKIKALDEILKGVIKVTKGDEDVLGKIFGEEGIRAVSVLAKAYRDTNGFDVFENLINGNYSGTVLKDFDRYSETISFKIKRLMTIGERFGTTFFSKTLTSFSNDLEGILKDPKKVDELNASFENFAETLKSLYTTAKFLGKTLKNIVDNPITEKVIDFAASQYEKNLKADMAREKFNAMPLEKRQKFFADRGETDIAGIKEYINKSKVNALLSGHTSPLNNLTKTVDDSIIKPVVNNSIALSVNVDQSGNITNTEIIDSPAQGVDQQTFLESFFRGN